MAQTYSWTVDVEGDWGGRVNSYEGLDIGLPVILDTFERRKIKGLFFISTEIMEKRSGIVSDIQKAGHELGCHGHFHTCFKEPWRARQNMLMSQSILSNYQEAPFHWRAPKFSTIFHNHRYSDSKGHIGLLKHTWFGGRIPENPIFYLHPFDLVESDETPPNLFCRIWYSKPSLAKEKFNYLTRVYPGEMRL